MRQRRTIVAAVSILLIISWGIVLAFHAIRDSRRIQKNVQDLSRMMSVRMIVCSALSECYKTNGSYPKVLEELPAGLLQWGDEGSSAADLKLLRYNSTSNTFTFTWHQGTDFQLFAGGRTGELFWTEEDFATSSQLKR